MTTAKIAFLSALLLAGANAAGQGASFYWTHKGLAYQINGNEAQVSVMEDTVMTGEVVIPDSVPEYSTNVAVVKIADNAFKDCSAITKVTIEGNEIEIGKYAFDGCSGLTAVEITGAVSRIDTSAFYQCISLSSINLPEGLREIEAYAFYSCEALANVATPKSLTRIGPEAFSNSGLNAISLSTGLETIDSEAFRNTQLESLTLPTTVTSLGKQILYDNSQITELCIPKSVSHMDEFCLYQCTGLKRVVIEDGSNLDSIPGRAFANCSSLEEVVVGDGVSGLDDYAFSTCSGLTSVTLPKTLNFFGDNAFSGCEKLTSVKYYATQQPELVGSNCFSDLPSDAKLYVPDPEIFSNILGNFKGSVEKIFTFDEGTEAGSDKVSINADGNTLVTDIFKALSDENGALANANVYFKNDITLDPTKIDLGTLSASNIFGTLDAMPTVEVYDGEIDGATISNLAVRSSGLFGTLGDSASIDGLVLNGAMIYVDPTDESFTTEGDEVFIHLLAKKNCGRVTNFGFSGDIIVDEELAKGKDISVCLVDEDTEDAVLNGFMHIGGLIGTGNTKRCITIKQNLGVKRPLSKNTKIAASRSLGNKSLGGDFNYTEDELLKPYREFTDEEFASGVVAYWLNYAGPGYTGEYTGRWSQGKEVPVAAKTVDGVSNALYAVDYGKTDIKHLTSAPKFANNGSEITIAYDKKPISVTIGGKEYAGFGETSMTVAFDHNKTLSLTFGSEASTADVDAPSARISVSGKTVTVSGADGERKQLYDARGSMVGSTFGESMTAPAKGLYIIKIGDKTQKLTIR